MSISNILLGYDIVNNTTNSNSALFTVGVLNTKTLSGSTVNGTWVCPSGVYHVDVVCIGGGGAGGYGNSSTSNYNYRVGGNGGGGGGLGWRRGIPVTPGQSYSYQVGAGVAGPVSTNVKGGDSWFISPSTVLGGGGQSGGVSNYPGLGGTFVGEGGGNGGKGGHGLRGWAISTSGGGGGAGGYYGNGGRGGNAIGGWVPGVIIAYRSAVTISLNNLSNNALSELIGQKITRVSGGPNYYNMTNIPTGTSSNPTTGYPYEYVGIGGAVVGGTLWSSNNNGNLTDFGTIVAIFSTYLIFKSSNYTGVSGTYIGVRGSDGWDGTGGGGGGGGGAGNLKSLSIYSSPTSGSGGGGAGVQGNFTHWSSFIATGGTDYLNNTYTLNSKGGQGGQFSSYAYPNTYPLSGYPGYGGYGQDGGLYSYNYQIGGRQGSLGIGGNFGGGGGGGSSYTVGAGAISSGGNGAVFIKWGAETSKILYIGGAAYGFPGNSNQTIPLDQLTGGIATSPSIGDIVIVGYSIASASKHDISISSSGWNKIQVPSPSGTGSYAYVSASPYDENRSFVAYYKFMSETVDNNFVIDPSDSLPADSIAVTVSVFRNVNSIVTGADPHISTIFGNLYNYSRAIQQTSGYNGFVKQDGSTAMPEARPQIYGSVVFVMATGSHVGGLRTYKCNDLGGFVSAGYNNTYDITIGAGWRTWDGWISGSFYSSPFLWSDGSEFTSNLQHKWDAVSICLRPS
jgi:hypothetical protein